MFMNGMSAWDKNSMKKGQKAIQKRNEQAAIAFEARFLDAIEAEELNPTARSINEFCRKYKLGNRTFQKKRHKAKKDRILALPTMRGKGNPNGWKKNAWWVKDCKHLQYTQSEKYSQ